MNKRIFCIMALLSSMILGEAANAADRPDPGVSDQIIMDSVVVKPGESTVLKLRALADDITTHNKREWKGVGSFCIPLKYDMNAIRIDSARFVGSVSKWDEKFTNSKIDTGFISFAGIYNLGGGDNPALFSAEKPEEIIRIFATVAKDAAPGPYLFELTPDPIQKELYFGSIDGYHSWKPQFQPGKIVVK